MASIRAADYEEVSPYLLLRELPTLANNLIPSALCDYCDRSGMKAWELLEEGIFYFFRQILMLDTIRMGGQSLFKNEPEGIVLVSNDPNPFAALYECKARTDPYRMSSDDVLRYRGYIRKKRVEVKEKQHLDLTHVVIASCDFAGDVEERLHQIEAEGVVVSLFPARHLLSASRIAREMEFSDIRLLDLRRLFRRGVAGAEVLSKCFGNDRVAILSDLENGGKAV